jgi:hypothetical protein
MKNWRLVCCFSRSGLWREISESRFAYNEEQLKMATTKMNVFAYHPYDLRRNRSGYLSIKVNRAICAMKTCRGRARAWRSKTRASRGLQKAHETREACWSLRLRGSLRAKGKDLAFKWTPRREAARIRKDWIHHSTNSTRSGLEKECCISAHLKDAMDACQLQNT